ncbi:MAG: class I SAM-dependent methyltransferase [Bacteroidota bacterium]
MAKYKDFDEFYSTSDDPNFGLAPSVELKEFIGQSGMTGSALDLACGEGRDTLFLLDAGYDVTAVDVSQVALDKLEKYARDRKLSDRLTTLCMDFTAYKAGAHQFDLITSATGLDHVDIGQTRERFPSIVSWLKPGGVLYLMVHTVDDPGFAAFSTQKSELNNMIRHYFRHNELLDLVRQHDLRILRYEERMEEDHIHGKPHKHGFATVIARKQENR